MRLNGTPKGYLTSNQVAAHLKRDRRTLLNAGVIGDNGLLDYYLVGKRVKLYLADQVILFARWINYWERNIAPHDAQARLLPHVDGRPRLDLIDGSMRPQTENEGRWTTIENTLSSYEAWEEDQS